MGKKFIDREIFIKESSKVHNNYYSYDKLIYKNLSSKVIITCPVHGDFTQTAQKHLHYGRGCWECGKIKCVKKFTYSKEKFIELATERHGDKYDYSLVEYVNSKTQIIIICPTHGEFSQVSNCHLQGQGCPKCGKIKNGLSRRLGKEEILSRFKKRHDNFYTYGEIKDDILISDSIEVICPIHGIFTTSIASHLQTGCKACGNISIANKNRKLPEDLKRVVRNFRRNLKKFMQKEGYVKKEKSLSILGLSWADFKEYLEDNLYGFTIDNKDLDLDHIVPISSAKTEEEVVLLNHWSNFQLLPKTYNQYVKRDNPFCKKHFEEWLINTNYLKDE